MGPETNPEWRASGGCAAGAYDGPSRGVGDFGGDFVALVDIAIQLRIRRGVDADGQCPVLAQRGYTFRDQRGRRLGTREPERLRAWIAPAVPAGEPGPVAAQPTVTVAVEPIPRLNWVPEVVVRTSLHLVTDRSFSNRSSEVVLPPDCKCDTVAETDRLVGAVNRHLEFGLLVLLQAERAAAVALHFDAVDAEAGICRRGPVEGHTSEPIGGMLAGIECRALGIFDQQRDLLVGKRGFMVGLIACLL